MQLRRLGSSGLKVSALGLGGNTFGTTVHGTEAVAVIHRAMDLGVTFIDTADIYARGKSEEIIGEALAGRRSRVVLATKLANSMGETGYEQGLSRRWIMRAVEDSLRRLKTDYIDLYQAHVPDPETPIEESLHAMDDLVRQGKVRYIGSSNFTAWQVAQAWGVSKASGLTGFVSAQNRWNIIEGLDDPHLLPACRELGVGLIPYTPLASGILTGKYRPGEAPPPNSRAADLPRVRGRLTEASLQKVEQLNAWAQKQGHTSAELGIAWLLAYPEVSTVIVGARTGDQVEQNLKGLDWTLSAAERDEAWRVAQQTNAQ